MGISSDGINAIVAQFIIGKKSREEDLPREWFELTPWEQAV